MAWPSKRTLRRAWRPFRIVAGFALLGVAVWFVAGKSTELSGASAFLTQLRWEWLALAGATELGSYLSMAALQRTLLGAGGTMCPLRRVAPVTFAGSAIQSSLPAGSAFAGLYYFRQFEILGSDEVLSGWVVVATAAVSFATLSVLAGLALSMAASTGSTFDLVGAIVGVCCLALLAMVAWARRAAVYRWLARGVVAVERRTRRPPGQLSGPFGRGLERMRSVAPSRAQWARALMFGAGSWLADGACLMSSFLAVGAGVPWQGLLLAYCGAQLAVNLPVTPGGLGVVEGSLTVALVAFGGAQAAVVAAVLLYRVVSFWVPLPVGATCYVALARARRRGLKRQAMTGPPPAERLVPWPAGPAGHDGKIPASFPLPPVARGQDRRDAAGRG